MNELYLRSTFRNLQMHLGRAKAATVMAGIALVLGLSGPFDTWTSQSLPERMIYWTLVVWLTYGTGFIVTGLVAARLQTARLTASMITVALAVAIAVFMVLFALNMVFGQGPETPEIVVRSFAAVQVICLVIEVAGQALGATARAPVGPDLQPFSAKHVLPSRLPLQKRGELLSLSAQDHYVDIVTSKGHEMLLIRLGDAMRETAPVSGLQVHRSHWVAKAAVASVERRGDGAVLTLTIGQTVPVSRAFMPSLREAGLLPGKGA